jgi:hypothetical protein
MYLAQSDKYTWPRACKATQREGERQWRGQAIAGQVPRRRAGAAIAGLAARKGEAAKSRVSRAPRRQATASSIAYAIHCLFLDCVLFGCVGWQVYYLVVASLGVCLIRFRERSGHCHVRFDVVWVRGCAPRICVDPPKRGFLV